MTTETPAELRIRIADVLADVDGWVWAAGFDKMRSPSYQECLRQADAILAALPELDPARRVLGTTEQADTETAPEVPQPGPLTAAERTFLTFALDLAFAEMVSNDGFEDEDHAALEKFRRLADEAQQPTPAVDQTETADDAAMRYARRLLAIERLCSGHPGYHTVTVKQVLTAMSDADEQPTPAPAEETK